MMRAETDSGHHMRLDLVPQLFSEPVMALRALVTWPRFSISSFLMVRALAKQNILPRTVLDIGANVGQFAVAAAKLYPGCKVISFEPVPDTFEILHKCTRKLKNVSCFNLGLGVKQATMPINVNSHRHSSSFLPLSTTHKTAFPFAREESVVKVPVTTLDIATRTIELLRPVLLKLDVQGFERHVLEGGSTTLAQVDYVIVEASLQPMYGGETLFLGMIELLQSYGFEFLRPIGWLPHPSTGEILQVDCLFGRGNGGDDSHGSKCYRS